MGLGNSKPVTVRQLLTVDMNQEDTYDIFLEKVWLGGIGLYWWQKVIVLKQGDRIFAGNTRLVMPFVIERIATTDKPRSMHYNVPFGLPLYNHSAQVYFNVVEPEKTEIDWSATFTPIPILGTRIMDVEATVNQSFADILASLDENLKKGQ